MNVTKIAVLITFGAIIKKYQGNWATPSQNTILSLLATFHNITIKRRMLGYHLADLRAAKLITTIKRHKRDANGQISLISSATALTMKGCYQLFRLGNEWALKQLEYLKSRYGQEPPNGHTNNKNHKKPVPRESTRKADRFEDPGFRAGLGLPAFPPYKA